MIASLSGITPRGKRRGRIVLIIATVVLALFTSAALATTTRAAGFQDQAANPVEQAAELLQQGFNDVGHDDASAATKLDEAIHAEGFGDLSADLRYRALLVASLIAQQNGENQKAHDLIVRATVFDEADDMAWLTRLSSAFALRDYDDAGRSLTVLAGRWPEKLSQLMPEAIAQLHYKLQGEDHSEIDGKLLDALFDAKWLVGGIEPSEIWRDLALLHLERNEPERATEVALRITSGQVALSLLVDKRFDPVTRERLQVFDVDRLVAAEIETAQAQIKAHPEQLEPVYNLQELFLITRQYPRVLSISDPAVAHARQGDGEKTYTDFDDRYIWILDNRARAMEDQGHWEDAAQVETLAARHPEHGGMNVSQLINLADLYADLGEADKAAAVIVELGDMSPFGRMQLESVKLRIAVQKKDDTAIEAAMGYLREHRADAIGTWEDALLLRGQLDEAAALLIERLENPAWRNAALVEMQDYADVSERPMRKTIDRNWSTIKARSDVRAAVQKVGRVEHFNITSALR